MTRVVLAPQYDLLGKIAEWVIALDYGGFRVPVHTEEFLVPAQQRARELMSEHRASRVTIEIEDTAEP